MKVIRCGCNKHFVEKEKTVSHEGQDWDLSCLVEFLENENKCLKNIIRKIACCGLCDKPLGRTFKVTNGFVTHTSCMYDLGGES